MAVVKRRTVGYPKNLMKKAGYTVIQRKLENKRIFSVFFEDGKLVMQAVKMEDGSVIVMTRERYLWRDKIRITPEVKGVIAECYTYFSEGGTLVETLEVYH